MARKRDQDEGGNALFWLLLGFLCGVMATLGVLLMLSGQMNRSAAPPAPPPPVETPAPKDTPLAPGRLVIPIPTPPRVEPAAPIQEPVVRPVLPTFRPEPKAAPAQPEPPKPVARPQPPLAAKPAAAPPPRRSNADQMAEDAAASGMTARTR